MITALGAAVTLLPACAFRRSKSAKLRPPTLKAPTLRKSRRLRPSQYREDLAPQIVSIGRPSSGEIRLDRFGAKDRVSLFATILTIAIRTFMLLHVGCQDFS